MTQFCGRSRQHCSERFLPGLFGRLRTKPAMSKVCLSRRVMRRSGRVMRRSWKRGSRCQIEDQARRALTSGSVSETGPPGRASSSWPNRDDGPEPFEAGGKFACADINASGLGDQACNFVPVAVGLRHKEKACADDEEARDEVEPDGKLHERVREAQLRREPSATSVAD